LKGFGLYYSSTFHGNANPLNFALNLR